jgi:hypothetical protein
MHLASLFFDVLGARIMGDDQHGPKETGQRLQKILQGAFSGPPTPLKDIPKKSGVARAPRAENEAQPPRKRRRQRKNRAA